MVPYWSRLFADWFYGDSASSKRLRYETRDIPIVGDLSKWYDTRRRTEDYMRNRNIDWSSVKYPSLIEPSSGGNWHALFSPSADVLERMYDDASKKKRKSRKSQ